MVLNEGCFFLRLWAKAYVKFLKLLETRGFSQYPGVYGTSSIHFYDPEYTNQPINQTKYRKYTNPNVVSIFSFLISYGHFIISQ